MATPRSEPNLPDDVVASDAVDPPEESGGMDSEQTAEHTTQASTVRDTAGPAETLEFAEQVPALQTRDGGGTGRAGRWVAVGLLLVLFLAGTGIGGFFAGQSTRKSDEVVKRETDRAIKVAVGRAVSVAVAKKGAEDKEKRLRIMHRAATRMNARHRVEIRKLRRVADRKADQAYSSGSNAGREAGYSDGVGDGITKASDDLTCSDDPDVPLPYCSDY